MEEHCIRLRLGWEWSRPGARAGDARQVSLPLDAGTLDDAKFLLTRRFGCPRLAPLRESLWLRLEHVPRLVAVRLNGGDLPLAHSPADRLEIPLRALPPRNTLELEVSGLTATSAGPEVGWGLVCLVIRPERESSPRPLA